MSKQGILTGKRNVLSWIEQANNGHMAVRKVFDLCDFEYRSGRLTLQQLLAAKVRILNDPEEWIDAKATEKNEYLMELEYMHSL